MAAQDSTVPESQKLEALAKQIAELESQWNELDMAIRRSATIRRFLILVVVAILGIYIYLYYTFARGFVEPSNRQRVVLAVPERALPNLDAVTHQVNLLVEHTRPAVSKAFGDQLDKDLPAIQAKLEPEYQILIENLQRRADIAVDSYYHDAVVKHRRILEEEFPSVKDPKAFDTMIANLQESFDPLVEKYYGGKIKAQLEQLNVRWQNFPMLKDKRTRDELADDLYGLLIALVKAKTSLLDEDDREGSKSRKGTGAGANSPDRPGGTSGDTQSADGDSKSPNAEKKAAKQPTESKDE
jgi:hypothetical protein